MASSSTVLSVAATHNTHANTTDASVITKVAEAVEKTPVDVAVTLVSAEAVDGSGAGSGADAGEEVQSVAPFDECFPC